MLQTNQIPPQGPSDPVKYLVPVEELLAAPGAAGAVPGDPGPGDRERAAEIVKALEAFRIPCELKKITCGHRVTRFTLRVAPDTDIGSVTAAVMEAAGLDDVPMRVSSPGPGRIDIELPGEKKIPVPLRQVLESEEMKKVSGPLTVALGADINGRPVLCDLAEMPHLLIAGSVGSGKTVCLRSILCSLVCRAAPEQVRLILADPGQMELTDFDGIPHLMAPMITSPRKVAIMLDWLWQEQRRRYESFMAAGARNLSHYNELRADTGEPMPRIVVIIHELSYLTDEYREQTEECILALAALAKAAGIHLIMTAQRVSEEVITETIRDNIPGRIAFQLLTGPDSRLILDEDGAEWLTSAGDMLYRPCGSESVRVQGCWVSGMEACCVADYLKKYGAPRFDGELMKALNAPDPDE